YGGNNDVSAVADNVGTTYDLALGPQVWADADAFKTSLWTSREAPNVSGVDLMVSAMFPGPANFASVYVSEYANVAEVDQSAVSVGTGDAPATEPKMTAAANEVIFGHGEAQHGVVMPGAGFTVRSTENFNVEEDLIVSSPDEYDVEFAIPGGATF